MGEDGYADSTGKADNVPFFAVGELIKKQGSHSKWPSAEDSNFTRSTPDGGVTSQAKAPKKRDEGFFFVRICTGRKDRKVTTKRERPKRTSTTLCGAYVR